MIENTAVDARSLADAIDAHGIYDEMATREKIDRHYRKGTVGLRYKAPLVKSQSLSQCQCKTRKNC